MPISYSKSAESLFGSSFKNRVADVYSHFPELQESQIACGAILKRGPTQGVAYSWLRPQVIRLRAGASLYTVAHELTHLLQGRNGVPGGEVACDIWTVDRMPLPYLDERPYYLLSRLNIDWHSSKADVKTLCSSAISLRRSVRTYISWLRSRLRELEPARSQSRCVSRRT